MVFLTDKLLGVTGVKHGLVPDPVPLGGRSQNGKVIKESIIVWTSLVGILSYKKS